MGFQTEIRMRMAIDLVIPKDFLMLMEKEMDFPKDFRTLMGLMTLMEKLKVILMVILMRSEIVKEIHLVIH